MKANKNATFLKHCFSTNQRKKPESGFLTYDPTSKCIEPRSQCLSSLPPLVVGRKTLVAAGHMTTQNLLDGRGGRVFCLVDVTNFVGFKSSSSR